MILKGWTYLIIQKLILTFDFVNQIQNKNEPSRWVIGVGDTLSQTQFETSTQSINLIWTHVLLFNTDTSWCVSNRWFLDCGSRIRFISICPASSRNKYFRKGTFGGVLW